MEVRLLPGESVGRGGGAAGTLTPRPTETESAARHKPARPRLPGGARAGRGALLPIWPPRCGLPAVAAAGFGRTSA